MTIQKTESSVRTVFPRHVLLAILLLELFAKTAVAQNPPAPVESANQFHHVLTSQLRETFVAIRDDILRNPNAADTLAARTWILETARQRGWEADALKIAELEYPKDVAITTEERQLGLAVRAIGLAQQGDVDAATTAWSQYLRALRLRQPNVAGTIAQSVSLAWQLRQQADQADAVYQQLTEAYFLNAELKDFAERRRARLKLIGQPVPDLAQPDLTGRPVEWSDLQGRVVLLDFWATNCRPCIDELPQLRRRFSEFHRLGVEFVGISFDESPADIAAFRELQPLPWRIVLDRKTAEDAFGVTLIPCLMLVDRTGNIVATDVLPSDLNGALDRVLPQPAKD